MLVRFTELEMSIRTTIALLDKDVDVILLEEWLLAQKIKLVLQPMTELTDFISEEKYPSASSVIIVVQDIQEDLKELKTKKENRTVFGLMEPLESDIMMRVGWKRAAYSQIQHFWIHDIKIFFFKRRNS
ncbi:hypothetical protein AVEN_157450-1 [Araneus ventricosus]|uniref:Uncharacterized protein n=1 Tax=Araneus ventricosus TaxID=182803 RepID=A0A4Y2PVA5_ARAVE|nr:hypothetical protein AVEN_157450-1 [Araneus ventricosus]